MVLVRALEPDKAPDLSGSSDRPRARLCGQPLGRLRIDQAFSRAPLSSRCLIKVTI